MMTFASESVRKSLTGARHDDPEVIPLTCDAIATRRVSLVILMCLFVKNPVPSCPSPPLARGSSRGQTGPSRLLEVAMGPYCMGEPINSGYQISLMSFGHAFFLQRKQAIFSYFLYSRQMLKLGKYRPNAYIIASGSPNGP